MAAPLVSVSLGCDAIFLLGGTERSSPAQALWIRSGDVTVLSGPARLAFHSVPRIVAGTSPAHLLAEPAADLGAADGDFLAALMADSRVNLNVRQVLPPDCSSLAELYDSAGAV